MASMDHEQAASLIEAWIQYYDMAEPEAWEKDEYPSVKEACKAMRYTVQLLRGKSSGSAAQTKAALAQLEIFPEEHCMDDSDEWEKENVAFVKQVFEALRYATDVLRKQK